MCLPSPVYRIFNSSQALIHPAGPDGFFGFFNQDVEGIVEKWGEPLADGASSSCPVRLSRIYPWMLLHHKVALILLTVVCRAG
jgi:hypothetical protein